MYPYKFAVDVELIAPLYIPRMFLHAMGLNLHHERLPRSLAAIVCHLLES